MIESESLLQAHRDDYLQRVDRVSALAARVIPQLDNTLLLNGRLNAAGQGDLRLVERAEVAPLDFIPDPTNEGQVGAFAYGFHMTEFVYGDRGEQQRVPLGISSIRLLLQKTVDKDSLVRFKDHRSRTAYYRALTLFPGFFVNLTADISDAGQPPANYGPEIFLAYQVMSRLIDTRDPGVISSAAKVDRRYLFRRVVKFPELRLAMAV